MLLELRFSICTLGLGAGTFIAALYGMNLKNFIEESDLGFWAVSGVSAALSVLVLMYGLGRLRRVQRINMWGECPPEGRGWWRGRGGGGGRAVAKDGAGRDGGLWGLGNRTAGSGLGAAEIRAERLRRLNEMGQAHALLHRESWHAAKRRKLGEQKSPGAAGDVGGTPTPGFD